MKNLISLPMAKTDSKREELNAQALAWKHSMAVLDSMLLKCAIDLEIADTLHRHGQPMTISQLGSSLPEPITDTDALRRIMRYLVHLELFSVQEPSTEDEEELYEANLVTKFLLKDSDGSIIPFVRFTTHPSHLRSYLALGAALEGEFKVPPFELVHGETKWEHASKHPDYNKAFNESMESSARRTAPALIDGCRDMFGEIGSLVDVGGGTGTYSQAISKAYPHIKCTVLDLPHVVATAPQNTSVEYVAGDMFVHIPKADAVMLMWILHDWNDEECLKILERCKEAIPKEGGRVIIAEIVIKDDEEKDLRHAKLGCDMLMLGLLTGKERTEKEWKRLINKAGFSRCKITHIMTVQSVIEAFL